MNVQNDAIWLHDASMLRAALSQFGFLGENDDLPKPHGKSTGVAEKSRVYFLYVPQSHTHLVAKVDEWSRATRELRNVASFRRSDLPTEIILPLEERSEGKKDNFEINENVSKERVILYRDANGYTVNKEWGDLLGFLNRQLSTSLRNCKTALNAAIHPLDSFYIKEPGSHQDTANGKVLSWEDFFGDLSNNQGKMVMTAKKAWPEINWQADNFHVAAFGKNRIFQNPFKQISGLLQKPTGCIKLSRVHGDLNLTNILLGEECGKITNVFIIDFPFCEPNRATAIDFACMEREFWQHAFVQNFQNCEDLEQLQLFVKMRDALDRRTLWNEVSNMQLANNCISFVKYMRDHAARFLSRRNDRATSVSEYFHCLFFSHLRSLTFKTIFEQNVKSQIAILGAALALEVLQDYRNGLLRQSPLGLLTMHKEPTIPKHIKTGTERLAYEKKRLYSFPGGHVRAIRLFGADDIFVSEKRLRIVYQHKPLKLSADEKQRMKQRIDRNKKRFTKLNVDYFNGPNTRLISFEDRVEDGPDVAREEPALCLYLGPIGWHEYDALNGPIRDNQPASLQNTRKYAKQTGLQHILEKRDISHSRLSNILDTATTIITVDGYIAYSRRGSSMSALPNFFTSTVAENINRFKDDVYPKDLIRLRNDPGGSRTAKPDNHYVPKIPHPFATVLRGVAEELSPKILPYLQRHTIKLIGISFDLRSAHPDLLFLVPIPLERQNMLELCREQPGRDYHEGQLQFFKFSPLDEIDARAHKLLSDSHWTGGGHASVVRTLEFVAAYMRSHSYGDDFAKVFDALMN